jgi:RNA polymerase sigma-70 factor (ECF subfamily)
MNAAIAEQYIIDGCAKGNAECQRMLFDKLYSKMLALCKRYTGNTDEAKDMLQDGFIKVFENIHKYRGESSLQTWVSRIMINNAINQLKKNQRLSLVSLENEGHFDRADETEEEATDAIDDLNPEKVIELIQQLPTGYRTILNLYAIEGFTHKQIAIALGIAEGTSKSQLSKARQLLKQELINQKRNA